MAQTGKAAFSVTAGTASTVTITGTIPDGTYSTTLTQKQNGAVDFLTVTPWGTQEAVDFQQSIAGNQGA